MKKGNKKNRKENRQIRDSKLHSSDNEMTKLLKTIAIIVVFLAVFVTIAYLLNEKDEDTKDEATSTIQYDKILAANVLSQKQTSYYVLVEYEDDYYVSLYEQYLGSFATQDTTTNFYYTVDLTDTFNKWAVAEESNLTIENIGDIKFNASALLKIENGKIVNSYIGFESIDTHLRSILEVDEES